MKYLIILLATFTVACNSNNKTLLINSYKVDCSGVGDQTCLQVAAVSDSLVWENFYDAIEGFDYQPGYIYKLEVAVEEIPASEVPADASNINYKLIKVLSKEIDPILRINDIWLLTHIGGNEIETDSLQSAPTIEFHVSTKRVIGSDGCNRFNGGIKYIDHESLEFSPIASTRMMCQNMAIPDKFESNLSQVTSYRVNDGSLELFNSAKQSILGFKKVD